MIYPMVSIVNSQPISHIGEGWVMCDVCVFLIHWRTDLWFSTLAPAIELGTVGTSLWTSDDL
jgi:hypothetical protein